MEQTPYRSAVLRIERMEAYFDALQQAWAQSPDSIPENPELSAMLHALRQYMDSGLWLQDYTLDDQKLLPATLKRGVLSQDELYNFLCDTDKLPIPSPRNAE